MLGSSSVRRADPASGRIARAVHCVLGCVIALLMLGGTALADGVLGTGPGPAQQPTAAPTPNPNWCSRVPASWTPPKFGDAEWAEIRQSCVNGTNSYANCLSACLAARDLWERWKEGDFNHPPTSNWPPPTPNPTKHFQVPLPGGGSIEGYSGLVPPPGGIEGPFPLPGGGKGIIMHIPPAPAATPTASGPQGFADPSSQHGSADHRASL
jgi:hypothetical protein